MIRLVLVTCLVLLLTAYLFGFVIIDDFNGSGPIDRLPYPTSFRGISQGHFNSAGWTMDGQGLVYSPIRSYLKAEVMRSEYAYYVYPGSAEVLNFGGVRFLNYLSQGLQDHGGAGFHWRDNYNTGFDGFFMYIAPATKEIVLEVTAGVTRPYTDHTYEHTYFIKSYPCSNNPLAHGYGIWRDYRIAIQTIGSETHLTFEIGVWPNFQFVQWQVGSLLKAQLSVSEILQYARRRSVYGDPAPCGNVLDGPSAAEDGLTQTYLWRPVYVMGSNDYMNTDTFYRGY